MYDATDGETPSDLVRNAGGGLMFWVSDAATHFTCNVWLPWRKCWMSSDSTVANSTWSNGTWERMMREVVRTLKAILQDRRRNVREVDLVPVLQ